MEVTTWRAATLGVRIGGPNRDRYFSKAWRSVTVRIDGVPHEFPLSDTFWTTCPEIRGRGIPAWLRRHGLDTWPKGQPHRLQLVPLGGNCFELKLL